MTFKFTRALAARPRPTLLASLAASVLLGACATTPAPAPPASKAPKTLQPAPAPAPQVVDTGPLLNEQLQFQLAVRQLPQAELVRQIAELGARPVSGKLMLRRAMLLAALRGNGDLARAQALVDSLALSDVAEDKLLRPLAQALSANYAELRRQDEAQAALAAQLREAQRRNDQLNVKLEALKNIERSLSVRPGATK